MLGLDERLLSSIVEKSLAMLLPVLSCGEKPHSI
jgi:hypothetical protein